MRSPWTTVSPAAAQTMMRRAIKPAMSRTPSFWPGASNGMKPSRTFSLNEPQSLRVALRYWPAWCLRKTSFPLTGAFCTCTSNTDRKIDMRRQLPPMNSFSVVSSTTSTVPCAGATTRPWPAGTRASGSRKKFSVKIVKKTHRTTSVEESVSTNVPITLARKPTAISSSTAPSASKINFSPACRAFPACFTPAS